MLTESCAMNYCQDGLQVYFATETYDSIYGRPTDGHYELQPKDVNGRTYFKMGSYGFWWNNKNYLWMIGEDSMKGESAGYAYYDKDVFCPHQLSEWNWLLMDPKYGWYNAGNDLGITCKFIFFQNKTDFEFHILR